MESSQFAQKLWDYCSVLRDEGLSYGDYVEQLTYLLFLKMADGHSRSLFKIVEEPSRLLSEGGKRRDAASTLAHFEAVSVIERV